MIDCNMFCNKPSIEESKFKCVCNNFKCKLIEKEQDYCEKDSDCICGKNKNTGVCGFWGRNFGEISKECAKFCGIPGGSMCIKNKCGGSILN